MAVKKTSTRKPRTKSPAGVVKGKAGANGIRSAPRAAKSELARLRQEVAQLREENRALSKAVCSLMAEKYPIDYDAIDFESLKRKCGKGPSIEEILQELEDSEGEHGLRRR